LKEITKQLSTEERGMRKEFVTKVKIRLFQWNLRPVDKKDKKKRLPSPLERKLAYKFFQYVKYDGGAEKAFTYAPQCTDEIQDFNKNQMLEADDQQAINKIKNYIKDGDDYIERYVNNAIISYCRRKTRRWNKIERIKQSGATLGENQNRISQKNYDAGQGYSARAQINFSEPTATLESADAIAIQQKKREDALKKFKDLLKKRFKEFNITRDSIKCFNDRVSGMSFPDMMRKYDPENFEKDKRGQKYHKRFHRTLKKLDIDPKLINNHLKEKKLLEKLNKKPKYV
jgi:hypothetical protein